MRVFIVEKPKRPLDISSATKFGPIEFIFGENDRRCSVFDTDNYSVEALRILEARNFDASKDILCIVGSMVTVVITLAAILSKYSEIQILIFSASEQQYILRKVGEKNGRSNVSEKST
jgi:hypothetical protein